jgi:ankyrin repeat protein
LIASADKGDLEKVRQLVSRGISPNQESRLGESILATAIRFHKKEIALALIEAGADPYSPQETNAIWAAAAHGEREVLARLLQSDSPELRTCLATALASAVQMGHVEIVGDLLKAGANPSTPTAHGLTPLMSACFRGYEVMSETVMGREIPPGQRRTNWASIVTQLLKAGADVNARATNGVTALMMARASGQKEIAEILEKAGADPAVRPPGPEVEKLAEAFRARKKEGVETNGVMSEVESLAAAARSGRAHLDPQIRDMILRLMKMNQRRVDRTDK